MLIEIINHIAQFASVKTVVLILLAEKETWEQKECIHFCQEILVSKKVSDSWVFPQLKNACIKSGFSIPPRVKRLVVRNCREKITSLPETLKYLSVEFSKQSGIYTVLPKNLKVLRILDSCTFSPKISEGIKTLKIFATNCLWHIPKSVTTLVIERVFDDLIIPNTVKKLFLSFSDTNPHIKIPLSVEYLNLCNYHQLRMGFIPNTVKKLVLFGSKGSFVFVPRGVEELIINTRPSDILFSDFIFEDPGNIRHLRIDRAVPSEFIDQFVGVKNIIYHNKP